MRLFWQQLARLQSSPTSARLVRARHVAMMEVAVVKQVFANATFAIAHAIVVVKRKSKNQLRLAQLRSERHGPAATLAARNSSGWF